MPWLPPVASAKARSSSAQPYPSSESQQLQKDKRHVLLLRKAAHGPALCRSDRLALRAALRWGTLVFPGPGTVVGGVIGGIGGGVLGAFAGEKAADDVYQTVNEP
jgi:hypothetical protein